jgi:hypothetical protein
MMVMETVKCVSTMVPLAKKRWRPVPVARIVLAIDDVDVDDDVDDAARIVVEMMVTNKYLVMQRHLYRWQW